MYMHTYFTAIEVVFLLHMLTVLAAVMLHSFKVACYYNALQLLLVKHSHRNCCCSTLWL